MKYIMNVLCHRLVFKFMLINAFSVLIIALAFPANLVTFNFSSAMGFEQERESRDTMVNQSSLKQLTNPTGVEVDPHTLQSHDNDDTMGYHSRTVDSDTGIETKNKNNWITVNHDIYSTRSSNQTIISKENVSQLKVKWTLFNDVEIQDPPIIIGNRGFVQDNSGAVIAFDTVTGKVLWKSKIGSGPTMGLTFNNGMIYAATAYRATVVAINATEGKIIWESRALGNPKTGYNIPTYPIVWKDHVIVGSAGGGDVSSGVGTVRGNITALNGTNGKIIWNLPTTTGEWVNPSTAPSYNSGANDWSGGSLDPETGILYMPLGSASPNFNATTRQEGDLYSNHMMAINITNGQIIWATPFIAARTVLDVKVPDTHDWDTSWGSSISKVTYDNGTQAKIVIGHDKMGNIIAMNAATGREIWWKILGRQYNTDATPKPDGSGDIWSYGIFNYHAVDSENTMYIAATNRGLNYFTDSGLAGHRLSAPHTIELGLRNGTIAALDLRSGKLKWELPMEFPPRVSPLVTNGIVFTGYIHFTEKTRSNHHVSTTKSGIILALGKENGQKLWQYNINAEIGQIGPSIGNGMLFVPTDKIQIQSKSSSRQGGSILAFGLP